VSAATTEQTSTLDLDRLLRLRLVVARVGEMDNARWWNTKEQLGRVGAITLRRGFPRTHGFAQARAVFTVAAHRCAELFDPPRSLTLWKLPASLEDAFEARWSRWLEDSEAWRPFFTQVAELKSTDLAETLNAWGLVDAEALSESRRLKLSAGAAALQVPATGGLSDSLVTQLALGFSRGEPGAPVIPYTLGGEQD